MTFVRRKPDVVRAMISGEREADMKARERIPGTITRRTRARAEEPGTASTIQIKENGIALAKAKPIRPNMRVCWESFAANATEIVMIHPAVVRAMTPKRRFRATRGL